MLSARAARVSQENGNVRAKKHDVSRRSKSHAGKLQGKEKGKGKGVDPGRKFLGAISKNVVIHSEKEKVAKKHEDSELPEIEYLPPERGTEFTTEWKKPAYFDPLISSMFGLREKGGDSELKEAPPLPSRLPLESRPEAYLAPYLPDLGLEEIFVEAIPPVDLPPLDEV